MSFEENVSSFYMALAEEKLEDMCQSLSNMRLVVKNALSQHLSQTDDEIKQEGAVHQEVIKKIKLMYYIYKK
jgi:hypothetical protein